MVFLFIIVLREIVYQNKWRYSRKIGFNVFAQEHLERRHKYTVTQISVIFPIVPDIPNNLLTVPNSFKSVFLR